MASPIDRLTHKRIFRTGLSPIHAGLARLGRQPVQPHDHDFLEVVLFLHGQAQHRTRDGLRKLRAGDVLLLRPGVWHAYESCRRLSVYNCCFGRELLHRELAWTLEDPRLSWLLWGHDAPPGQVRCLRLSPPALAQCRQRLHELNQSLAPSRPGASAAARCGQPAQIGRLLVFLDTLASHAHPAARPGSARPRPIPPAVVRAIHLLENRLSHPWRIPELAGALGIDPAALTRRFKAAMGLPPMAYLTRCRAEQAARLLLRTSRPIGEIARQVGWNDPVYFARRFRAHFGLPARVYRQRFASQPTSAPSRHAPEEERA